MKLRKLGRAGKGFFFCLLGASLWVGILLAAAASYGAGAPRPIATVDGKPIMEEDISDEIKGELIRLEAKSYKAKRGALESLIFRRLVKDEASGRGISPEEFLKEEVSSKVSKPSEEEMKNFYLKHQARINRPFSEVKDQLRNYMMRLRMLELRESLFARLKKGRDIRILLEPPRVDVSADDGPALGPPGAPVTIIEFSDFQCPYCARVQSILKELLRKYPKGVRLVYRDFPIESIHPQALKAAEAARCAGEQGKFWPYHDLLFENQNDFSIEALKSYARKLGLELSGFNQCLSQDKYRDEVRRDAKDGLKSGVNSTPTFFINGRLTTGGLRPNVLEGVILEELRLRAEGN